MTALIEKIISTKKQNKTKNPAHLAVAFVFWRHTGFQYLSHEFH